MSDRAQLEFSPVALMPVSDALAAVLAGAEPLPDEIIPLDAAFHRVLARDVAALRTQPPQAMSAMDGYAVRAADAGKVDAALTVIGEVAAGRPFPGSVGPGQAVRIFTGGVVPAGADAVVIQEDTIAEGPLVTIREAAISGRHIRPAGVDFREGDVLLRRGVRLSDRDLALAAGMNHPQLPVHRRPRVAILATGDELVMPGSRPAPGQIVYSNGFALHALARQEGAETIDLGIAADTLDATTAGIRRARELGVDILVTTGGASVGDHDLVQQALKDEGVAMTFWKIAMRPGKPLMFGETGGTRLLGLPGNPVSALVCGLLFLTEAIAGLLGTGQNPLPMGEARLGADLPENDRREDYLRATLTRDEAGRLVATAFARQDSSMLSTLADADCFIVRPPGAPAAAAGVPVPILDLGGGAF